MNSNKVTVTYGTILLHFFSWKSFLRKSLKKEKKPERLLSFIAAAAASNKMGFFEKSVFDEAAKEENCQPG